MYRNGTRETKMAMSTRQFRSGRAASREQVDEPLLMHCTCVGCSINYGSLRETFILVVYVRAACSLDEKDYFIVRSAGLR